MKSALKKAIESACKLNVPNWYCIPVWGVVSDLVCIGSTSSIELCKELGVDPHHVLPSRCWNCGTEHGREVFDTCPECGIGGQGDYE